MGQTAIAGIVGAGLLSVPLIACRGVGLIDFVPEEIPGALIGKSIGLVSSTFHWTCYFLCGALIAWIYRFAFRKMGAASWDIGLELGLVHWLVSGIALGFLSFLLPASPLFLPSDSPAASLYGLMCSFFILALHLIFGAFMSYVLVIRAPGETRENVAEHPAGMEPLKKAA